MLDLDPDDPEGAAGGDAGPAVDAGGGTSDAGGGSDAGAPDGGEGEDGSVVILDGGDVDAARHPECGDGFVDAERGEECDDGNDADGDGCDRDCTFSCESNVECQDGDMCNGAESCNPTTHACQPGGPVDCPMPDACHTPFCDPRTGCGVHLVDADGDGHAPLSLGSCGSDCNDADPTTYVGAPERCDAIDHDCDGSATDASSEARCYADADADGFGDPLESRLTCEECVDGEVARGGDCFDADSRVNPAQTSFFPSPYCDAAAGRLCFDYDCNGVEEQRWPDPAARCRLLGALIGCAPSGWDGPVPACGEEGTWLDCAPGPLGLTCGPTRSSRTQECR